MKSRQFKLLLASPAPANVVTFANDIASICDDFMSWPQPAASTMRKVWALAGKLPVSVSSDCSTLGRRVVETALAAGPDLVLVDFPHAAVLLPSCLQCPSVIFTHNVEAEIFERHAAIARGPWRLVWADQARKMRDFENTALHRFDCTIAVSERDAQSLWKRYRLPAIEVIDTGVDLDFYSFSSPHSAPDLSPTGGTLVFVGAMNSPANIDAVGFMLDEIWPHVIAARPEARMVVVGRDPPVSLVSRASKRNVGFEFTGYVEDTRPYIARSHVVVIPMRVGSGTRIKAFEAMAMGRPVVSTSVGVEGLGITAGAHYFSAESPIAFAQAILRLLADVALRDGLARAARAILEERFSWSRIARRFEEICMGTYIRMASR